MRIGNIELRRVKNPFNINDSHREIVCWRKDTKRDYCYVVAFVEGKEDEYDLRMIGPRYWELSQKDRKDFDDIVKAVFNPSENDIVEERVAMLEEQIAKLKEELKNYKK